MPGETETFNGWGYAGGPDRSKSQCPQCEGEGCSPEGVPDLADRSRQHIMLDSPIMADKMARFARQAKYVSLCCLAVAIAPDPF